mgnify:FL=1
MDDLEQTNRISVVVLCWMYGLDFSVQHKQAWRPLDRTYVMHDDSFTITLYDNVTRCGVITLQSIKLIYQSFGLTNAQRQRGILQLFS